VEPLAAFGDGTATLSTNLSRSISLTLTGNDGDELPLISTTSDDDRFHIWIPHDPNISIPPMALQNVTTTSNGSNTTHHLQFNYHFFSLKSKAQTNISAHVEFRSLNTNSSGYLLIYRFDVAPRLNSSMKDIDGWSIICPLGKRLRENFDDLTFCRPIDMSHDNHFVYFINSGQTSGRESIILGLRQLNETELIAACSPAANLSDPLVSDAPYNFTTDYEIRLYLSACYFYDRVTKQWKSDGMTVSLVKGIAPRDHTLNGHCF
jgi:hypothetical protein